MDTDYPTRSDTMRTTVGNLIKDAIENQTNTTASNGRWKCRINKDVDAYIVTHHKTDMLIYYGPNGDWKHGSVFPLDPGWGSQTDKQGINSMLSNVYTEHPVSYHSLYSGKAEESSRIEGPVELECERCGRMASSPNTQVEGVRTCRFCGHSQPLEVHEEPKPKLEKFTPPIAVEDTIV